MAEVFAVTGSHTALPVEHVGGDHRHIRALWKAVIAVLTTAKRAPPPAEDDIDLLVYAVMALTFVVLVAF